MSDLNLVQLRNLDPSVPEHKEEIDRRQRQFDRTGRYSHLNGIKTYSKQHREIVENRERFLREFDPDNPEMVKERQRRQEFCDQNPEEGFYLYGLTGKKRKRGPRVSAKEPKGLTEEQERERKEKQRLKHQKYYHKFNKYRREKAAEERKKVRRCSFDVDDLDAYPDSETVFIKEVFKNRRRFSAFMKTFIVFEKRIRCGLDQVRLYNSKPVGGGYPTLGSFCKWGDLMCDVSKAIKWQIGNTPYPGLVPVYEQMAQGYDERVEQYRHELFGDGGKEYFGYDNGLDGFIRIRPEWVVQWCIERGLYRLVELIWDQLVDNPHQKKPWPLYDEMRFLKVVRASKCFVQKKVSVKRDNEIRMIAAIVGRHGSGEFELPRPYQPREAE